MLNALVYHHYYCICQILYPYPNQCLSMAHYLMNAWQWDVVLYTPK